MLGDDCCTYWSMSNSFWKCTGYPLIICCCFFLHNKEIFCHLGCILCSSFPTWNPSQDWSVPRTICCCILDMLSLFYSTFVVADRCITVKSHFCSNWLTDLCRTWARKHQFCFMLPFSPCFLPFVFYLPSHLSSGPSRALPSSQVFLQTSQRLLSGFPVSTWNSRLSAAW